MKPITFIAIEEEEGPGGQKNKPFPPEPITFFGLTETKEKKPKTASAVENIVKHEDSVNFFGISILDSDGAELEDDDDRNSTVMIVEDDKIVSTMLKHLLERKGYRIEIVSDGRGAADLIESKKSPALVILDVMLPFVDGFALIRQIRDSAAWEEVPIIMLTAKTREEDIVRALDAGANDYIVKPFHPHEVLARVKRFVRK